MQVPVTIASSPNAVCLVDRMRTCGFREETVQGMVCALNPAWLKKTDALAEQVATGQQSSGPSIVRAPRRQTNNQRMLYTQELVKLVKQSEIFAVLYRA